MKGNNIDKVPQKGISKYKMLLLVAIMTLGGSYSSAADPVDETHEAPVAGTTYVLYPGKRVGFINKQTTDSDYHNGFRFPDGQKRDDGKGSYLNYIFWDYNGTDKINWFSISETVDVEELPVLVEIYVANVRKDATPPGSKGVINFWIDGEETTEPDLSQPYRKYLYAPDVETRGLSNRVIYMIPGDKLGYSSGYKFKYNDVAMDSKKQNPAPMGSNLEWYYDGAWNWITANDNSTFITDDGLINDTVIQINDHHIHVLVYDSREHANQAKENNSIIDNHSTHNSEITVKPGSINYFLYGTNWFRTQEQKSGDYCKGDGSVSYNTNTVDGWYFKSDGTDWNYFTTLPGYGEQEGNRTYTIYNYNSGDKSKHHVIFNVLPADVFFEYPFTYSKNNSINEILSAKGVRENPAIGNSPIVRIVSTDIEQKKLKITQSGDDYILDVISLYNEPVSLAVCFENGAVCEIKTSAEDKGLMWTYKSTLSESGIEIIKGNFKGLIADEDALYDWNIVDSSDPSYQNRPLGYDYVVTSRTPNSNLGRVQYNGRIYYFYAAALKDGVFVSSGAASTHLPNIKGVNPVVCWFENEMHEKVYLSTVCVGNEGASELHPWQFGGSSRKLIYTNCGAKENPKGGVYPDLKWTSKVGTTVSVTDVKLFQGIRPQDDGYYVMQTMDEAQDEFSVFQYSSVIEIKKTVLCSIKGYEDTNDYAFSLIYTDFEGKSQTEGFTLKNGESMYFIPQYGTSATVTETACEGYTTTYSINGSEPVSGFTASYDNIDFNGALFEFFNTRNSNNIIIQKSGLKAGESAMFTVKVAGDDAVLYRVLLTGTNEDNVSATIVDVVLGEYTVEETNWSWSYNTTSPEGKILTQDIADENVFSFTNEQKAKSETPLHDEKIKVNSITNQ